MKRIILVSALAAMAGGAHAQSSVTLSGTIGGGMRWTTGAKGGQAVGFDNNIISGNNFGLTGTEDLGQGLKAIFTVQSGFVSGTGNLGQSSGLLFSKAAFVGLAGNFGRITLGRQLNAAEEVGIILDPSAARGLSLSTVPEVVWGGNFFTLDSRFNNAVKYVGKVGGFSFKASYSPGGIAGNTRAGSNLSVGATYQYQTSLAGAAYQKTYNASASQWAQTVLGGVAWQLGPARLYLNFTALSVTAASSVGFERHDKIPAGGFVYQVTPFLQLTAATYYDMASNLSNVRGADGRKLTSYAMAEYFLSKRTELYMEFDQNGFSGAYKQDPTNVSVFNLRPDGRAVTGVSIGMMTQF